MRDQRFHLDPRNWFQPQPAHPALEALAQAVWSDRRVRFAYERTDARAVEREADAVALALKSGFWYLVARVGVDLRVYRVSRMSDVAVSDAGFTRDPAFDLGAFWAEWASRFEDGLAAIPVTVRVSPAAQARVAQMGDPATRPPADAAPTLESDGWLRRVLVFEKLEYARAPCSASARSRGARAGGAARRARPSCARARRPIRWRSQEDPRRRGWPRRRRRRSRAKQPRKAKRPAAPKSPEARAAQGEIQAGLRNLAKSIGEIQRGLRTAEREIEADTRKRIAELRKEGRAQLGALHAKGREVAASLRKASPILDTSWDEIKQSADAVLGDARAAATSFASRIRDAIVR